MIENLNESEILRYLGYPEGRQADTSTLEAVRRCSGNILHSARPKWVEQEFQLAWAEASVRIADSDITLEGTSIYNHLSGCEKCVVMAATLGIEADRAIRQAQISSMSEAVVIDACATAYIEAVCDEAEKEINHKYGPCNFRFSPGYGDLPISLQKDLLSLLQAEKKIGLCVNTSNLLIPGKSVTAILGVGKKPERTEGKCGRCPNKERCAFCRYGK